MRAYLCKRLSAGALASRRSMLAAPEWKDGDMPRFSSCLCVFPSPADGTWGTIGMHLVHLNQPVDGAGLDA